MKESFCGFTPQKGKRILWPPIFYRKRPGTAHQEARRKPVRSPELCLVKIKFLELLLPRFFLRPRFLWAHFTHLPEGVSNKSKNTTNVTCTLRVAAWRT